MTQEYLNENTHIKTFDLGLAATLISLGQNLTATNRPPNTNRVEFIFERNHTLDDIVQEYWDQDLAIEPQSYFNALKGLKNRIYSS